MRVCFLTVLFLVTSCSSVQKMALRGTTPVFVEAGDKMLMERDWEFYRESAPGNLKLIETVYLQDKDNTELLATMIKAYAGYAFTVPETLALDDELSGADESAHKKTAIALYTRALDYGLDYFQRKGITRKNLLDNNEKELVKILEDKFKKKDHSAVLFTAQAWGSLINLQKDNVALVSHIPKVKTLFDWVCKRDPSIENGVCDIFFAQYEANLPRIAGGNPEKARELYQNAIKKRPKHLLIRQGYIQFSLLPAFDKEAFDQEAKVLVEELSKWDDISRDNLENRSEYKAVEHLNLFNAIAKKRFEIIQKYQNKIFEG